MGELMVSLDLMKKGYQIFRGMCPTCTCDLIAIKDGRLYRVEVTKGITKKIGNQTKLRWAPHDPSLYDVLAVWEENGTITYDVPEFS